MRDKREGYRLSPQQRWLWWMRERDGGKDTGRARVVLRLSGPLDLGALRRAIELVCERHEALRTSFFEAPSIRLPLQVVGSRASVCWIENGHDGVGHRDAPAAGLIVNVSRLAAQEHDVELTASPLCVDSASLQIIAQEVTQCYRAVTAGVTLDDNLMQYPDYADWQNELLAADDDEAHTGKAYWQRAPSVALKLPCEPVGDSRSGPVHETVVRKIDGDFVAAAEKLSASAEGYLLTCWIALLSRLSGNTKVVVAERVSGRKYDELEKSIGLFEKWLPVHAVVDHRIYFRELVTQVEALRSEGREWQDYFPFGQRDGELNSFPAIGFEFVSASPHHPVSANAVTGLLTFTVVRTERPVSGFKLLLSCIRKKDSFEIELQYNATAISRLDAERIVTQFTSILKAAANDPALRLGNVSLLSQDERETLVHRFNQTAAPAPLDQPVHRLFEAQVARTPDRLAVISGEIGLTFAGLNREANKLARFLRRRGVLDGAGVGLFLERSAHAVLGMLGILKAGAAYVPLDINAPPERLLAQIKEIGSPVIVTGRDLFARLPQLDIEAIFPDDDPPLFQSEADGDLSLRVDPESLAYIIYTSGSTGVPKGVAVTHRNLVNYAHFICREFQFYKTASQLNFAMVSAINADLGNTVIFPSLISGGCLHLLAQEEITDAARLADRVARDRIDVLKIVPSHMNALTASSDGACVLPRRQLFLGGEQLTADLLVRLKQMAPACELLNHYGPTEATVGALINHTENGGPQNVAEHAPVPIGSPIANLEAYVLDAMMQPVPPGMAGELYLGGEGVARGYQQQPAQTAEKFVPHPFATSTGARLYRTGDLARHLSNGKIEFIGRADDQVKIRGYRVELGEIKSALLDHPAVRDAVVVLRDERAGSKQLIAYVAGKLEADDLRAHLAARLPSYMLPAAYVFIDRLPLTRNGKVDRSALPPPAEAASATRKLAPPRTPVEQTLAAIWKDLLRVDQISVDDNFFELGGDSIVSIQVVARARRAGLRLLPKQIFSAQTIAELASVAVPEVAQTAEPTQQIVKGTAPLTPIQHWFFSLLLESPNHFNLALLLSVPSEIEGSHLRAALVQVLNHHDALRLRFTRSEQGWIQYHAKPSEVPFAEVDLSGVERDELSAAIEEECERWQRTLDLTEGPLVRMILMRLGQNSDNRLLIVAHHLVMDVVSWRILLDDLLLAYEQTRAGKAIELPAKTVSFKQWSEQLSEFARSEEVAEEIPYWRATIRGAAGRTPPVTKSHDKHVLETLNASLSSEATTTLIREALKAYRTEITDLLLAALARAVCGWHGQSRLLVEMEGHGREEFRPGLDVTRTVGWFTTHYPVLLDVEEEEEPVLTLKRVKDLLRAVPRRGLGFGLLRWLRGDRQLAEELKAASPADIKFNYLGQLDGAISPASMFRVAPESSGTTRESAVAGSLFDTNAAILDGRLHLRLMFDPATYTSARMQALLDRYTNELLGLIRHCATATRSFTSSDLPAAKLSQSELDTFLAALATDGIPVQNIEDIYTLSPMQEGLLFHSRSTPESDVYFRQLSCALHGELNVEALSLAWQTVLDRHPALRTSFHWTGLTSPRQVVNRRVEFPVTRIDWRGLSAEEQSRRLEELVRDERTRGFNVSQAPLMRFVLLRLQDAEHHIVWSYHHLLMDGWAKHSVFNQLLECYRAFSRGEELNVRSSRPYVDYIKWLQSQDLKKAEAYWRRRLEGVYRPTPIGGRAASGSVTDQAFYDRRRTLLSQEATAALQQLARSNQLTLNTVVQAAWAIFLGRVSRQADVVFGAVVAGRPSDLEGSERMIGLFVNTLPLRIQVSPESEVLAWCRQIQEQQVEMQQYEYSPLVMVQNWSSVPRGEKLFDSLLVFENYPIDAAASSEKQSLLMSNFNIVEYSSFPLTLMIGPAAELSLLFLYDCKRFDDSSIARMLATLSAILNLLAAARPETKLCEIDVALDEIESREQKRRQEELNELKLRKLKTIRRKMVQDDSASKASV